MFDELCIKASELAVKISDVKKKVEAMPPGLERAHGHARISALGEIACRMSPGRGAGACQVSLGCARTGRAGDAGHPRRVARILNVLRYIRSA